MAALLEYKCPCCGGAINFDSTVQKMVCPFCDTTFEMETLRAYDEQLRQDTEEELKWDDTEQSTWQEEEQEKMDSYVCNSCAGEIICDHTTSATSCPFCGNPVVMSSKLTGELRPDCVIPFQLDKAAAKEKFMQHLQGKRLLPKIFKTESHMEEIKGVYVPFWLFDCDINAHARYRATRIRRWSDRNYNYTETSYFLVTRDGNLLFEKVPADGSEKMQDEMMESLEPFDFSNAVDFQTAYLAGYLAEKYDVDAKSCFGRVNQRIKSSTESILRETVHGYATVVPEHVNVNTAGSHVHYALLPVWVLTTKWKDKTYLFAMNGQTGKFVGDLPLDKGAFWRWFFGLFAGISAVLIPLALLSM